MPQLPRIITNATPILVNQLANGNAFEILFEAEDGTGQRLLLKSGVRAEVLAGKLLQDAERMIEVAATADAATVTARK